MARSRFTARSRAIRFDDAAARRRTSSTDKVAPIRDVFELFVKSFQDCYIPNDNLTVDEQLVTFRGRCPFRQFIPSKPGKYGIKIWALCDSVTSYVYNMHVYTGREEGQNREVNQGQRVVLDLISGLEKSARNVTCDIFTSISLARELAKRQMTLLGTIRKNKGELPTKLTETRGRQENTSIFTFQDSAALVSYCPKKGPVVVLLSTEKDTAEVDNSEKAKPRMVLDYNAPKAGVDTMDQMVRTTNVQKQENDPQMAGGSFLQST